MISVSPVTNRLTTASYDPAGNLTDWNGTTYTYDPLNRLTQQQAGSLSWTHLYTAGGERLWTIHEPGGLDPLQETVSLRDLSGRVLRQYEVSSGLGNDEWSWKRDMIYGDGRLVSSVHPGGEVRHYHLDHLGTPRRVTDPAGNLLYQHDYLPYGEEITDSSQNNFPLKFTGHERDSGYAGTMDDLDYMRARYYSPFLGRFGRVDPLRGSPAAPQSLNRYAYVMGNPINLTDPLGFGPNREEGDVEIIRDAITVVASYYWYLTGLGGYHSPGRRMAEPHGPVFGRFFGVFTDSTGGDSDTPETETPGDEGTGPGDSDESSTEAGDKDGPEVLEMVKEVFCSAIHNWIGAILVEGGYMGWGGYASLVSTPTRAEVTFGGPIVAFGFGGGVYPVGVGAGGAEGWGLTWSGVAAFGVGRSAYFSATGSEGGSSLIGGIGAGWGGGAGTVLSPSFTFVVSDLCD